MSNKLGSKKQMINSKSNTAFNNNLLDEFIYSEDAETRIGVSIAEEEAKKESARRRINAPLTIEEKIFFLRHTKFYNS